MASIVTLLIQPYGFNELAARILLKQTQTQGLPLLFATEVTDCENLIVNYDKTGTNHIYA